MTDEKATAKEVFENTIPAIEPITADEVKDVIAETSSVDSPVVEETKKEVVEVTETVVEKPSSVVLPNPTMTKIPPTVPTLSVVGQSAENKLLKWWVGLFQKMSSPVMPQQADTARLNPFASTPVAPTAKDEAKNRLQLVLMHDRTQLSPTLLESMRDELVEVISKYVEIDKSALDLSLEQEADTIALVANISVVRRPRGDQEGTASV
jgi:cell division topological specificity factor